MVCFFYALPSNWNEYFSYSFLIKITTYKQQKNGKDIHNYDNNHNKNKQKNPKQYTWYIQLCYSTIIWNNKQQIIIVVILLYDYLHNRRGW